MKEQERGRRINTHWKNKKWGIEEMKKGSLPLQERKDERKAAL